MKVKIIIYILLYCQLTAAQMDSIVPVAPPVVKKPVEYYTDDRHQTTLLLEKDSVVNIPTYKTQFEEGFQHKYDTTEFDYNLTKPKESLWSKIQRRLVNFISKFLRNSDINSIGHLTIWIMRLIAVAIIGLVIYWLARFFINKGGLSIFSKKNKALNPEAQTIKENIHEIDFNQLIQSYEAKGNYRYAVRYQYLHVLKILNDKQLLEWDPDKTNLDYVNEIKNQEIQSTFQQLTHVFDYVWYGEFMIDEESYNKFKVQFNTLKQKV